MGPKTHPVGGINYTENSKLFRDGVVSMKSFYLVRLSPEDIKKSKHLIGRLGPVLATSCFLIMEVGHYWSIFCQASLKNFPVVILCIGIVFGFQNLIHPNHGWVGGPFLLRVGGNGFGGQGRWGTKAILMKYKVVPKYNVIPILEGGWLGAWLGSHWYGS